MGFAAAQPILQNRQLATYNPEEAMDRLTTSTPGSSFLAAKSPLPATTRQKRSGPGSAAKCLQAACTPSMAAPRRRLHLRPATVN